MLTAAVTLVAACTGVDPGNGSGSTTADTGDGSVASDCGTAVLGTSGGIVEAVGATLDIPPGALDQEDVHVELCPTDGSGLLSSVWFIAPAMADLGVAATLTLDHVGDELSSQLFTPAPDGTPVRNLTSVRPFPGTIEGPVYRFGQAWVGQDTRVALDYNPQSNAIDVLVVLDNSPSMSAQGSHLYESAGFIGNIVFGRGLDPHMGVVSTDMDNPSHSGRLREEDGILWADNGTPDPPAVVASMMSMGTGGSGNEAGLLAAYTAIAELGTSYNAGFVRPDAHLAIFVIADEDDESDLDAADFSVWLEALKVSPENTALHSIVGPPGGGIYSGDRYLEVSAATGGLSADIFAGSWELLVSDAIVTFADGVGWMELDAVGGTVEAWWVPADGGEPDSLTVDYDAIEGLVWVDVGTHASDEVIVIYDAP